MSQPIALGRPSFSPSPPSSDGALSAPVTPGKRLPVIDKSKVDPQTVKAAEGMEAFFLDYLMKTMRQTIPKNDMDLESPATEVYRSMLDGETAQRAAHNGGIGLADQIIAYLESERYNQGGGKAAPMPIEPTRRTGGTYEGKPNRK